jgi:hypothetical protein
MATQDEFNEAVGKAMASRIRAYDARQLTPLAEFVREPMYSEVIRPYLDGLIGATAEGAIEGVFAFLGKLSGGSPMQLTVPFVPPQ